MLRAGGITTAVLVGVLAAGGVAGAAIVGGGGSARTDCLLVFDAPVNHPSARPRNLRCTDGDPGCDGDGLVDGGCVFPVSVCGNSTFDPGRCTLSTPASISVDHAEDNGQDPKFDVDFLALQSRIDNQIELGSPPALDQCTSPTSIRVRLGGPFPGDVCKRASKKIRIVTLSSFQMGKQWKDTDTLKLTCDAPVPCDPQVLFAGTFDRIQRQVFNRSCALGGCHDSQSQAGGMLLEPAGSYGNIAGVVPANEAAADLGWRRIDAANAEPDTSFLYRKLTGDLGGAALGARMPFGRASLDQFLIDIVRLWIEAGAPQTGWVPGTD